MKNYFFAKVLSNDYEKLFTCDFEVNEGDFVAVDNGYLEPESAVVVKIMDKVKALASKQPIYEAIDFINFKPYLDRKAAEAERENIIKNMKEEIENVKLIETLDKYSGKSPKMQEYAEILKSLEKGGGE